MVYTQLIIAMSLSCVTQDHARSRKVTQGHAMEQQLVPRENIQLITRNGSGFQGETNAGT